MKRLLAILILVCMCGSAGAEFDHMLLLKYNAAAKTAGAPELHEKDMRSKDNFYQFDFGQFRLIFELNQDSNVKNVAIYADNESCAADFLCSCLAVIYTFKDIDITAAGMLMMQYSSIKAGKESIPYNTGGDAFQIISSDTAKYSFIYMNKDM